MRKLLILLLPGIVFGACKPSQNAPVPAGTGFYGRLYASRYTQYGQHYAGAETDAEFFNPGVAMYSEGDAGTRVWVQAVAGNRTDMTQRVGNLYTSGNPNGGTYFGSANNVSNNIRWTVYGANGVASFDWNDIGDFPDFTGTLPDSVSLSKGVTFNFPAGSLVGADTVAVVMDSRKSASQHKGTVLPGSITFTPADMAGMDGDTAYINVWMGRYSTRSFSGQLFASVKALAVYRNVPLRQ